MALHNILLLGSGGREHALAVSISKSPKCCQLYIAPGNAGTAQVGINLKADINNADEILNIISEYSISMVIVGPEDPLDNGIVDKIKSQPGFEKVLVFGPSQEGARLESSKAFAKKFMERGNIPTADYHEFSVSEIDKALNHVAHIPTPIVIKADGLAAGKGVIIAQTNQEAAEAIQTIFNGQFGKAGNKIVVESFLDGIEFSVFIATNGEDYILLPEAKDYKRIYEDDKGPNTGGMGSVSPVPFADEALMQKVKFRIIEPTLHQLAKENIHYIGFIFFGLIVVEKEPFVIEYNVRMGDPETEVVFPRIKSDVVLMFENLINGKPVEPLDIDPAYSIGFYIVSGGYPDNYSKGYSIDISEVPEDVTVFHGGTTLDQSDLIRTNGGRVLFVNGRGLGLEEARQTALKGVESIYFKDMFYRRDIGLDLMKYIK